MQAPRKIGATKHAEATWLRRIFIHIAWRFVFVVV